MTDEIPPAVEELIPDTQASIQLVTPCKYLISGRSKKKGFLALSEHLLILIKKTLFQYYITLSFHIFDIQSLDIEGDTKLTITYKEKKIEITKSNEIVHLLCYIYRNYSLMTRQWPEKMRMKITPEAEKRLPRFKPPLSLTQMFQFAYNGFCSYFSVDYFHSVTQFYHKLIITGDAFADFSKLPITEVDNAFGDSMSIRAVLAAMLFCPTIHGYIIRNVTRGDFLRALAPVVAKSNAINLIQCSNCNIHEGIEELAYALSSNPNSNITFFDLSHNNLRNISKLAVAFEEIDTEVLYLDLSDTGMKAEDTMAFVNAISNNKSLWGLRYILFRNAVTNFNTVKAFCAHLSEIVEGDKNVIKRLDLGALQRGAGMLCRKVYLTEMPIEYISLAGSKIADREIVGIIQFLERTDTIQELDFSNTTLSFANICKITKAINDNDEIGGITLHLNGLKIGGKLEDFFKDLTEEKIFKWTGLSLENNGITAKEFVDNEKYIKKLRNLQTLNIGGNFHQSKAKLKEAIHLILTLPNLQHLGISGTVDKYLGKKGIKYLTNEFNKSSVIELDVSGNRIGNKGIDLLSDMLENNTTIAEISFDRSYCRMIEKYFRLFDILAKHETINEVKWPMDDLYNILDSYGKREKELNMEILSNKYMVAELHMKFNQANTGIHNHLTKLQNNELDEEIDNLTLSVTKTIKKRITRTHNKITKLFKLPYPHMDEGEKFKGKSREQGRVPKCYKADDANHVVDEPNMDNLDDLQFRSLCMRRPGTSPLNKSDNNQSTKDTPSDRHSAKKKVNEDANLSRYDPPSTESIITGANEDDDEETASVSTLTFSSSSSSSD